MAETITQKADRYLTEGRVAVHSLSSSSAEFLIAGSGPTPYRVNYNGQWICTCPARVTECAHILACQKISKLEPVRRVMFVGDDDASKFIADLLK